MSRRDEYRRMLRTLDEWEPFLLAESRLPGPRANLELLHAVADEGSTPLFLSLLDHAPAPDAAAGEEFLAACGATGLGERIARGEDGLWNRLRAAASDPRWRVREGVAMGLQRIGDRDMEKLVGRLRPWLDGTPLERRAAVAGLCEPRLLRAAGHARAVLDVLDTVTASLAGDRDRCLEPVRVLRQALGYAWSVAVVACPCEGKARFEVWAGHPHPDIRWVVRENLKKKRLRTLDAGWVDGLLARPSLTRKAER